MGPSLVNPSEAKPKVKTKAKQRYLKRKKTRRKVRATSLKHGPTVQLSVGEQDKVTDGEAIADENPTECEDEISKMRENKSRKRRRSPSSIEDVEMEALSQKERSPEFVTTLNPTALPSFPPPVIPDPPSKSDLLLQGLDQALVVADIVDVTNVLPISIEGENDPATGLSRPMRMRLRDLGITELFAVQTAVLPFLLPKIMSQRALYQPYTPPSDVCVSAPTGSGKTLAYVLPIIEIISTRIIVRLRALIVLPTRDLVSQVRDTMEQVGKGRGLKIGTASGKRSFTHEQAQLVAEKPTRLQGGSSKVDVLICTPGRLIDHLSQTPNFTLQHLRFLVIDEADRLLAQSFQDWLAQVLAAIRGPSQQPQHAFEPPVTDLPIPDAMAPHFLPVPAFRADTDKNAEPSCQKLLFSATLTRDPGQIAALELRNPKYFVVQSVSSEHVGGLSDVVLEKFAIPTELKEHMITCEASNKPLMLFHLVHNCAVSNALVFTKSAESTCRLVRLFEVFDENWISNAAGKKQDQDQKRIAISAYSSDLNEPHRRAILRRFKAQEIQILVCSDLVSRGMDISHVSHVVSYDAPVDMRKYVHRVGRTARAGRAGDAWTLVESQEARHFKLMLREAGHWERVKRVRVSEKALEPFIPHYETALKTLKEQSS